MRANMWSRVLITLGFFSLSAQAAPPPSPEPGTRVTVRLTAANAHLPDPEKLVESVVAVGGEHEVRVKRLQSPGQEEVTLELWGSTLPQADIPATLRNSFPELASADIQVTPLDPGERPPHEGPLGPGIPDGSGGARKKVVKIIRTQ